MKKVIIPFVVGLIKHKNKYLLTKRIDLDKKDPPYFAGMWQIPGGAINFGETVKVAIKREIKEELGLDIEAISVLPFVINAIRKNWHGVGIVLVCRLNDVKQKIKLNEEADDYGWFAYKEMLSVNMLPGAKEAIKIADSISQK